MQERLRRSDVIMWLEGAMTTTTVTIPNVHLSLDDLILALRQLEPEARVQVAEALLQDDLDRRLAELIMRLVRKEPSAEISMADINARFGSSEIMPGRLSRVTNCC